MSTEELRRLLELAAKAAGLRGVFVDNHRWFGTGLVVTDKERFSFADYVWMPHASDGESRRLEVDLHLNILHNDPGEPVLRVSAVLNKRGLHGVAEFQDEAHRAAATRLAVLRAVAAIGETMKKDAA